MLQLLAATFISCASLVAVDGDTVKCDGVRMRLLGDGEPFKSGIDTPETRNAKCSVERELGMKAKRRLSEILLAPGIQVEDSGAIDRHKRPLVRLRLPNGSIAEQVLIDEGYAAVWSPHYVPHWCD
jgi:endonuclease YncB( thermonuclease family)